MVAVFVWLAEEKAECDLQLPGCVSKGADAEFSLVISDRTQGNQGKLRLAIRKRAVTQVINHFSPGKLSCLQA